MFYTLIKITATYGLRRSEVLGIKWSRINFDMDVLQIAHTIVNVKTTIRKNKTKNESSYRSYPLISDIKRLLLIIKRRQEQNRKEFGGNCKDTQYVFVWDDGTPYPPSYPSQHFSRILRFNNLPHIRFHDLRHSCASILLSKGFTLKDVQEWLGHSNILLTANTYGHLDIERKRSIANEMSSIYGSC